MLIPNSTQIHLNELIDTLEDAFTNSAQNFLFKLIYLIYERRNEYYRIHIETLEKKIKELEYAVTFKESKENSVITDLK